MLNTKAGSCQLFTCFKELGVSPAGNSCSRRFLLWKPAAKAAGIPCVGYLNPHSGNQDLSAANVLLESFVGIDERFFHNILCRSLGKPVMIADTKRLFIRELETEGYQRNLSNL